MKTKKIKGIYFVVFENGVKIGMSNDIKSRLKTYATPWSRPIKKIFYFKCQWPIYVEGAIKRRFAKNIVSALSCEFITGIDPEIIIKYARTSHDARPEGTYINRRFMNPVVEELVLEYY